MTAPDADADEAMPIGTPPLVTGAVSIPSANRLAVRAAAPIWPERPLPPCDHGLFAPGARNQRLLFRRRGGTS